MTGPDTPHLAEELTSLVAQLGRRMRAASAEGELTPSQRIALGRLAEAPATTAGLARAESVRPQSMRATLAVLEEQALVTRSPHPTDGRQVVFSLTAAGLRRLHSLRQAKQTWLVDALEERLDAGERAELAGAVRLLRRLAARA